jgi:hypothetical protein
MQINPFEQEYNDSQPDSLNIVLPLNFKNQRYAGLRKKVAINLNLAVVSHQVTFNSTFPLSPGCLSE